MHTQITPNLPTLSQRSLESPEEVRESKKRMAYKRNGRIHATATSEFPVEHTDSSTIAKWYFTKSTIGYLEIEELVARWFEEYGKEVLILETLIPPEPVLDEAKRIVTSLCALLPQNTDIYPLDGGKIAIEVSPRVGRGFLLVCEPGGSALCIVTVNGVSRRARYENSSGLPDGFLRDGLNDMQSAN